MNTAHSCFALGQSIHYMSLYSLDDFGLRQSSDRIEQKMTEVQWKMQALFYRTVSSRSQDTHYEAHVGRLSKSWRNYPGYMDSVLCGLADDCHAPGPLAKPEQEM